MRDGSIATLVNEHDAEGGRALPGGPHAGTGRESLHKSDRLSGFEPAERDKADFVSFSGSPTDRRFVTDRRFADRFASSRGGSV